MYDSSARWQYSLIPRFSTIDPLAEKYYHISPYAYCAGDPVNLVDPDGRWFVKVSASSNRGKNPYALYSVYDRHDNLIYRTVVKVRGTNGRDRTKTNSDTPTGKYRIVEWRKTGNANYPIISFGPNDILAMEYLEGEAAPGRNGIHTHGGRIQEPELSNTHGCIRMADEDIKELKEITERLEVFDSKEKEERFLYVENNLEEELKYSEREEIKWGWTRNGGFLTLINVILKQ